MKEPSRPESPPGEKEPTPTETQGRRPTRSASLLVWLRRLLATPFSIPFNLLTFGTAATAVFVAITLSDLPRTDALLDVQFHEPLRVYAADGRLIGEFGVQRRFPVAIEDIPPRLVDAFLAIEDSRFYEHVGVDPKGVARAFWANLSTGKRRQGASTITMQVARNFYLTSEKTFSRKFSELLLAMHIERTLTKEQILELYLNKIFFGNRAYGIAAAAEVYYSKTLDALTLPEMAMLAGIPKAPSANNPVSNPERALERRNYVLERMHGLGLITDEEYATARETPDRAEIYQRTADLEAGYFAEMVRRELYEHVGDRVYTGGYRVNTTLDSRLQLQAQAALRNALRAYDRRHGYRGAEAQVAIAGLSDADLDARLLEASVLPGLTAGIVLSASANAAEVYIGNGNRAKLRLSDVSWARRFIDADRRGAAPSRVDRVVAVGDLVRLEPKGDDGWTLSQVPAVEGALVAMSPADGAIQALVGGYAFEKSKFNRAVDARRQPGSSFKPFVYAAALEKGWTPASLILDDSISIPDKDGKPWRPANFDRKTMGAIRLRRSLTLSRNLSSIDLLQRVGIKEAVDFTSHFGFNPDRLPAVPSLVLGTVESSPLQMAGAYALFANGGFHVEPHFIRSLDDGAGRLFESEAPRACADCWFKYEEAPASTLGYSSITPTPAERVLDPRVVYEMNSLLSDVITQGTAKRALKLERPDIAGKTGTTNDVRDSWFCGYQKELVVAAWMGFDDYDPLGKRETGGQAALGMWVDFMAEALKDVPEATLDVPEGMVQVRIDKSSGRVTRSKGSNTLVEWVREEYASALEGPKPVKYVAKKRTRRSSSSRSSSSSRPAPRAIDELF